MFLPPQETPGLRAFFCQHLTPDLIRRGPWLLHAIRAVSLKAVVTVVERPSDLAPAYGRLFGAGAVSLDGDALRVECGEGELLFVTPDGLQRLYPEVELPPRAVPWIAAMRVGVLILADAAEYLDDKGVRFTTTPRGMAVLPDQINGTIVEFVAE